MNAKPAWLCALSTMILAGTAHAQPAAPVWYPPEYLAHISIQATPTTQLEVVPEGGAAAAVARCTEYCEFWALPGRYTVYAHDSLSGERKQLSVRLKNSSRFKLQAGDDQARNTGFGIAIGGSAAVLAGLVLVMPVLLSSICEHENCTSESERDAAAAGLALLLAGSIAMPIGWSIYASNRTRLRRIDERSYQATETTGQVRVGLVGLGGGLGLGGVATF